MSSRIKRAFGYQDDNMSLPVSNIAEALPFYETILGFQVVFRSQTPFESAILARDDVQIGLVESGGDPSQDGCAFHVVGLESLFAEFQSNGLGKETPRFDIEENDGVPWRVFYVIAPDGLCYWFGERANP